MQGSAPLADAIGAASGWCLTEGDMREGVEEEEEDCEYV